MESNRTTAITATTMKWKGRWIVNWKYKHKWKGNTNYVRISLLSLNCMHAMVKRNNVKVKITKCRNENEKIMN